jgi:hypothetical protein
MSDFTPFDEAGHMAQTQAGMEAYARAHAKPRETEIVETIEAFTPTGEAGHIEVGYPPADFMQGCQTGGYVTITDKNGENPIEVFIGHFGLGIVVGPTDIYAGMKGAGQFTTMIYDSDGAVAMIPPQSEEVEDYNGIIERRFDMVDNNEDFEEETHQILYNAS